MNSKKKIAIVMELEWPYNRHFGTFAGIQDYAREHPEWELQLSCFPNIALLNGAKFDGILGRITKNCFKVANKNQIPMVNVWLDSPVRQKLSGVYLDTRLAGQLAAEHLVNRGFRKLLHIGFIGSTSSKHHFLGMRDVAKKKGLECEQCLAEVGVTENEDFLRKYYNQIEGIQKNWKDPVGIGCAQDELAHVTLNMIKEYGWKCPDQVAIVGTADEALICETTSPTLSSVRLSDWRCGYEAAQLLDSIIEEPPAGNSEIFVPPKELVIRGSSDSYAIDDEVIVKALRFMIQNLQEAISVPEIAAKAGVGRQVLERRFRKKLSRSVNNELIRLRVSKLKRLLVGTKLSVGEIAYQSGFGTSANMNVMFKRHTGMSPTSYRKKHSN